MAESTKSTTIKKGEGSAEGKKGIFIQRYFPTTGNISAICRELKIDRGTYYQWMEKDPTFKQAILDEQEGLIDFVESKAFNLINDKNPTMIIFFLKTKAKHRGYIETLVIGGDEKRPVRLILEEDNSNSPSKNSGNDKDRPPVSTSEQGDKKQG